MRCMTMKNRFSDGISVRPNGIKYLVTAPHVQSLAIVSDCHFKEMIERGHATDDTTVRGRHKLSTAFSLRRLIARGPVIHRCDFEWNDRAGLCLVPEKEESNNLLIWAPAFANKRKTATVCYPSSNILCTESDELDQCHYMIFLAAGSAISFYENAMVPVPGTGPSLRHPLRRRQYVPDAVLIRRLNLDHDGLLHE